MYMLTTTKNLNGTTLNHEMCAQVHIDSVLYKFVSSQSRPLLTRSIPWALFKHEILQAEALHKCVKAESYVNLMLIPLQGTKTQ